MTSWQLLSLAPDDSQREALTAKSSVSHPLLPWGCFHMEYNQNLYNAPKALHGDPLPPLLWDLTSSSFLGHSFLMLLARAWPGCLLCQNSPHPGVCPVTLSLSSSPSSKVTFSARPPLQPSPSLVLLTCSLTHRLHACFPPALSIFKHTKPGTSSLCSSPVSPTSAGSMRKRILWGLPPYIPIVLRTMPDTEKELNKYLMKFDPE